MVAAPRPGSSPGRWRWLPWLLAAWVVGGCATFGGKMQPLRDDYGKGDFAAAEAFIDDQIAKESGVALEVVRKSGGTDPAIDPAKGDTLLFLLDKGMLRLAADDPDGAVKLWRRARNTLDDRYLDTTDQFVGAFLATLKDDTARPYAGADYEHIVIRVMLCLADLMAGGGDAYAYAAQVGQKQEEIIGSPLGEVKDKEGYRPRATYQRVAAGAYLQGVIREADLDFSEAAMAYERAAAFEPSASIFGESLERVKSRASAGKGEGVLEVIRLAGLGPHLTETRETPGNDAFRLAGILVFLAHDSPWLLTQAPVPVPRVAVNDTPPPITVEAAGKSAATRTILDLNQTAREQLAANMPWVVARALTRRAWKAAVGTAAGKVADNSGKPAVQAGALAAAIILNIATTATENADTRSWTTLPAEVQAARLELPAGIHEVELGPGRKKLIRIAPGRTSYLLLVDPSPGGSGAILVDPYSDGARATR